MNYENDFTNEFSIYLNSAQALTGATTPKNCIFSIGSVLNQAPNIQNFQNCAYCKITLKYFSVFQTAAQFTIDGATTLLIKLATAQQPNGLESVSHIILTDESGVEATPTIGATEPWEAIINVEFPIKSSIRNITDTGI